MSKRHRRGYNGRKRRPRRPARPKESTVVIPAPPPGRARIGPTTAAEREKHIEMLQLIERTKERLTRQAKREFELERQYEDEPMLAPAVWRQH